jgi:hypothetical protein
MMGTPAEGVDTFENGEGDPSPSLLGNRPDSQEVPEKGVMIITRTGNWNCTEYTEYGVWQWLCMAE